MSNTMFFNLLLNIGLLVLIATMLTKLPMVRSMLLEDSHAMGSRAALAVIFGLVSIFSTYTGVRAQGVHDYHGKGNKTHQVQGSREGAGDEKDNGHLPNFSQSRDEKYPGAVNLAGLKTFGKGGADQALHKGGDSAAHRGKASDIKEIPVKSSYDGGSDSHIGTA